jgi:divalent metal cation (Fe/Co/Zn/Cd) transporter
MAEGKSRHPSGRLFLFVTLWLMLFLLSVKLSAAWATRSLSLAAESLHALIASFGAFLSLLTITTPDRPSGPSVQGHGKREAIITFILIVCLGCAGLNLLGISVQQLIAVIQDNAQLFSVRVSLRLMQLLGGLVAVSLGLAVVDLYQGRRTSNRALRFSGGQVFRDAWLTLFVMGGLLGVKWGWAWLDAGLAIVLVLLAALSCWQVIRWHLPFMVQQTAIAPEALAHIARQAGGVTHCYNIRSRGLVGRFVFVQMHLIVHPEFARETPFIAEQIQELIQERYGPVQVTFYVDDDLVETEAFDGSTAIVDVNGRHDLN